MTSYIMTSHSRDNWISSNPKYLSEILQPTEFKASSFQAIYFSNKLNIVAKLLMFSFYHLRRVTIKNMQFIIATPLIDNNIYLNRFLQLRNWFIPFAVRHMIWDAILSSFCTLKKFGWTWILPFYHYVIMTSSSRIILNLGTLELIKHENYRMVFGPRQSNLSPNWKNMGGYPS